MATEWMAINEELPIFQKLGSELLKESVSPWLGSFHTWWAGRENSQRTCARGPRVLLKDDKV